MPGRRGDESGRAFRGALRSADESPKVPQTSDMSPSAWFSNPEPECFRRAVSEVRGVACF